MTSLMPDDAQRHLSVLVAGLYGPGGDVPDTLAEDLMPQLEMLLARATPVDFAAAPAADDRCAGFDTLLYRLFEVDIAHGVDLPIAATTRFSDCGISDSNWWIRADPVHLEPHGTGLVLSGNEMLDLTQSEAERLAVELREIFTADTWLLETPRPERWYLRAPAAQRIKTHSPDEIRGRDVGNYLPSGPDAKTWHSLLNEAQILLHASPVNLEREQRGCPPINSLWFWGGGCLPSVAAAGWTQLWGEDALARGLARLAGAAVRALPANATHWLRAATRPGAQLLVFDQARAAVQYGDWANWQNVMGVFEELWIAPLVRALRAREITSLTLYTEQGSGMRVTRRDLGRWWRHRRRVPQYRMREHHERINQRR